MSRLRAALVVLAALVLVLVVFAYFGAEVGVGTFLVLALLALVAYGRLRHRAREKA